MGAGRPKVKWTAEQYSSIEYMAMIHCTQDEMCGVMKVTDKTLCRLIKEKYDFDNFSDWYKQYSASGNMSLRRQQFKAAENGNVGMLIWLGKQWLGQKEMAEQIVNTTSTIEMVAKEIFNNDKTSWEKEASN